MRAGYRTILSEMVLAQSAALGAFADVTAHYALLLGEQYQAALATLATEIRPKSAAVKPNTMPDSICARTPAGLMQMPQSTAETTR